MPCIYPSASQSIGEKYKVGLQTKTARDEEFTPFLPYSPIHWVGINERPTRIVSSEVPGQFWNL
jgi:hypothetical protein